MTDPNVQEDGGKYVEGEMRYLGYSVRVRELLVQQRAPVRLPGLSLYYSWGVTYHAEVYCDGRLAATVQRDERDFGTVSWLTADGYGRFEDVARAWVEQFELGAMRMKYGSDYQPSSLRAPMLDEFGEEIPGEFEDEEPEPDPQDRFLAYLTLKAFQDALLLSTSARAVGKLEHFGPY